MQKIIVLLASLWMLLINSFPATAQQKTTTAIDSARVWIQQHQASIDLTTYQTFKETMKPMLNSMSAAQVVGLGEGTHGTSEFQTVRSYITRYLCEEKGFSVVSLENSFGWCVQINKYVQTGEGNLDTLMKQNLLGMWQNTEIKELLQWMQQYNKAHKKKIQLAGIDYSASSTNARIVQEILNKLNDPALSIMADTLLTRARFMDAAYADMNAPKQTYKWKDLLDNGVKAYEHVRNMKATLDSMASALRSHLTDTEIKALYTTLYNSELAFYSIYKPVKEKQEASRDEIMAQMVKRIAADQHNARVVVWAHNAHLAKEPIFADESNGGGTGMFLNKYFPGNYFAVGTATGGGTFSTTADRFILSTSPFKNNTLTNAIKGSWEQTILSVGNKTMYIDARDKQYQLPSLPLRYTGYRTSSENDFMPGRINTLFDGFIFIPVTQATHIRQ